VTVDGERYTAAFRVIAGAMIVTCGAVSRTIELGYADDIKSVARTVLKAMVSQQLHGHEGRSAASRRSDDLNWLTGAVTRPRHRSRTRH
jgi:hypothetical protein